MMSRRFTRFLGGLFVACTLGALANSVDAATCSKQCSCTTIYCGGEGCSCSTWESAWVACGGLMSCDSSGCATDCPGATSEWWSCCKDYCPCE